MRGRRWGRVGGRRARRRAEPTPPPGTSGRWLCALRANRGGHGVNACAQMPPHRPTRNRRTEGTWSPTRAFPCGSSACKDRTPPPRACVSARCGSRVSASRRKCARSVRVSSQSHLALGREPRAVVDEERKRQTILARAPSAVVHRRGGGGLVGVLLAIARGRPCGGENARFPAIPRAPQRCARNDRTRAVATRGRRSDRPRCIQPHQVC